MPVGSTAAGGGNVALRAMAEHFDLNGDGVVGKEEFTNMILFRCRNGRIGDECVECKRIRGYREEEEGKLGHPSQQMSFGCCGIDLHQYLNKHNVICGQILFISVLHQ